MRLDAGNADAIALRLAGVAVEAASLLREHGGGRHRPSREGRRQPHDRSGPRRRGADHRPPRRDVGRDPDHRRGDGERHPPGSLFFLVDPLDGTGDFIRGTGEYSVNIALIEGCRPIAAVVAAPPLGRIWIAGGVAKSGRDSASGDDGGFRLVIDRGSAGDRTGPRGPRQPAPRGPRDRSMPRLAFDRDAADRRRLL